MIHAPQKLINRIREHFSAPRERGAALVEAAIAIPLLLIVIMGSVEFGFAWEARSASASGVRTGILRAATIGDRPETDMRILQSIIGEVGPDNVDRIDWVVIFEASDPNRNAAINSCLLGGSDCVVYDNRSAADGGTGVRFLNEVATTTDAAAFQSANFDPGGNLNETTLAYTCQTGLADSNWCAGKRFEFEQDVQLGVALQYGHEWYTGIFPFTPPTYRDHTVSSTFLGAGEQITGGTAGGVVIPSTIGMVANSTFNTGVDPSTGHIQWSVDETEIDPTHNFLGNFGNESVNLEVTALQPHTEVCVTFTLYLIDSWDGAPGDTFRFNLAGTPVDLSTTHGTPDPLTSQFTNTPNNLGNGSWSDQQTTVSLCVPHTGTSVSMDFSAFGLQDLNDESWAIDNVVVSVKND